MKYLITLGVFFGVFGVETISISLFSGILGKILRRTLEPESVGVQDSLLCF